MEVQDCNGGNAQAWTVMPDVQTGPPLQGLPTKVVTLWASSVALKRALLTVMALLEARLSVADVTHGVMLQGTTPET